MTFYLAGLNAIVLFIIIFGSAAFLTTVGLLLVRNFLHNKKEHWQGMRFTSSFFTIIGALLGVLLTMVLVTIWQNYQKEKENVISEVANYVNFYRDLGGMEEKDCLVLRRQTRVMIAHIINDSWPRMARGEEGIKSVKSFNIINNYLVRIKPNSLEQQLLKDALLKDLRTASDLRKNRNLKVTQSAIPEVMWFIMTLCAVISVSSGFFFNIRPLWMHMTLSLMHASMISIVIFLILSMMYPYRGATHITPESFEKMLNKTYPNIDREYSLDNKQTLGYMEYF